ncbi:hypothetical protein JFL43_17140 [Viridibacillus sp. YIM B01967]|uniref:Transposase n=1 Tax=Viridibacillus soli TaxID=2798301 RepID=A0ABS1HAV6_9BACL|nr:hypothetical protein [Viridibacillus soli]
MILYNAHIHHTKYLQDFSEENKHRLELVSLLPYSPAESLWKQLKESLLSITSFSLILKNFKNEKFYSGC